MNRLEYPADWVAEKEVLEMSCPREDAPEPGSVLRPTFSYKYEPFSKNEENVSYDMERERVEYVPEPVHRGLTRLARSETEDWVEINEALK
jgi:hypothetical protein